MNGADLKAVRRAAGWSQHEAAAVLRVTQAYLSMVEKGKRALSAELLDRVVAEFDVPAEVLPLREPQNSDWTAARFQAELSGLGYPGFGCLRRGPKSNPAEVLAAALSMPDLDTRVTEGLAWVPFAYPNMEWNWLVRRVKLADCQNRLGYVLGLAAESADKHGKAALWNTLRDRLGMLESSRLAKEDTLCKESMTNAERRWLRAHRPEAARHWNLLTDLALDQLSHVFYA